MIKINNFRYYTFDFTYRTVDNRTTYTMATKQQRNNRSMKETFADVLEDEKEYFYEGTQGN